MENGFFFVFLLCFIHAERLRKGGDPINSFMAWVGGKKALRDEILARFPLEYKRYIEVFGGAGWVLFHKPPTEILKCSTISTATLSIFTDASENSRTRSWAN